MRTVPAGLAGLVLLIAVQMAGPAYSVEAEASTPAQVPALLQEALKAADAAAGDVMRLKFKRTKLGSDDVAFAAVFDPAAGLGNQWTVVTPPADARTSEQNDSIKVLLSQTDADRQLIIDSEAARKLLGDDVALVSETDEAATFRASVRALPDPEKASGPINPADLARHLKAEIVVAKSPTRITALRIFAPEAFKPIFAARIDTLDILMDIEEAWAGGPLAVTRVERKVAGDAFYVSFAEHVRLLYSEFQAARMNQEAPAP